jgi:hypothetical protein
VSGVLFGVARSQSSKNSIGFSLELEHLHELVEEVQDLQEAAKGSVEPDKVRALARLVLELAQAVQGPVSGP